MIDLGMRWWESVPAHQKTKAPARAVGPGEARFGKGEERLGDRGLAARERAAAVEREAGAAGVMRGGGTW